MQMSGGPLQPPVQKLVATLIYSSPTSSFYDSNFSLWGYFYCAIATGNRPILIRCAEHHPAGNSRLTSRQKSIHHWARPIRYCGVNFCLSRSCTAPPDMSFRGGAKPRRGNLQHRSTKKYQPINIEYPEFSMLIGCFRIIPRSRRLHHRHSLRSHVANAPRNDSGSR